MDLLSVQNNARWQERLPRVLSCLLLATLLHLPLLLVAWRVRTPATPHPPPPGGSPQPPLIWIPTAAPPPDNPLPLPPPSPSLQPPRNPPAPGQRAPSTRNVPGHVTQTLAHGGPGVPSPAEPSPVPPRLPLTASPGSALTLSPPLHPWRADPKTRSLPPAAQKPPPDPVDREAHHLWGKRLAARIARFWVIPMARRLGVSGRLSLELRVDASGRIISLTSEKDALHPDLVRAAREAVLAAQPLSPPPESWGDRTVTLVFDYHG